MHSLFLAMIHLAPCLSQFSMHSINYSSSQTTRSQFMPWLIPSSFFFASVSTFLVFLLPSRCHHGIPSIVTLWPNMTIGSRDASKPFMVSPNSRSRDDVSTMVWEIHINTYQKYHPRGEKSVHRLI